MASWLAGDGWVWPARGQVLGSLPCLLAGDVAAGRRLVTSREWVFLLRWRRPVRPCPAVDPNLMVVGAPGTGKTVLEHNILASVAQWGWPRLDVRIRALSRFGTQEPRPRLREFPGAEVLANYSPQP